MVSIVPKNTDPYANNENQTKIVLLWIDPTALNEENAYLREKLTEIYPDFKIFGSAEEGQEFIDQLAGVTRIILIVSGEVGKKLVPRVHDLGHIVSIFIFCLKQAEHIEWAKNYKKIKRVIVKTNQLISAVKFEAEQRADEKRKRSIIVPDTTTIQDTQGKVGNTFVPQYTFLYLHKAGEFQYNNEKMAMVAKNLVKKFTSDSHHDIQAFIVEVNEFVMYLLKRHQNLTDFIDLVKGELQEAEVEDLQHISQRMLIDTILINSNRLLSQYIIHLLSRQNPIPLIQPTIKIRQNQYRSIPSILPTWDYRRPIVLSFGIGPCSDQTSLLNELFGSAFEESMEDQYFHGTVDLDFGYHTDLRRPVNIACTYGEITSDILKRISLLFNGFIIHVSSRDLCSNPSTVSEYFTHLPSSTYVHLIIHDAPASNDPILDSSISAVRSINPACQSTRLITNPKNKKQFYQRKIDELREVLFGNTARLSPLSEEWIRERLEELLDPEEKRTIDEERAFISHIRPVLVDATIEEHYPLYSFFKKVCEKRLETIKLESNRGDLANYNLFKLNDELYKADLEFKRKQKESPAGYGDGFRLFLELQMDEKSRAIKSRLLLNELKRQIRQQLTTKEETLSMAIQWRNLIIGASYLRQSEQETLVNAYRDHMLEGNPIEIIDGQNFEMQEEFLTKVFKLFPDNRFFVISVIGPQNSGKSTLLNFLFGSSFEAHDGRCTQGVYGTLINVQGFSTENELIPFDFDYVLLLDTEGLLSLQKNDEKYDTSLILFCLAVSHMVIINVADEINDRIQKLFAFCAQALEYLGEIRVTKPTVHFVLNKRIVANPDYCKELLQIVDRTLEEKQLKNTVNLNSDRVHILKMAFSTVPLNISLTKCAQLKSDFKFVDDIRDLLQLLIKDASTIICQTDDVFSVPSTWIYFAHRILQTIRKHPELTYFQEIFERNQCLLIQQSIRANLESNLSPKLARTIIDEQKRSTIEQIKQFFHEEYGRWLTKLERVYENEWKSQNSAMPNVDERSKRYLQVQLSSILRTWQVSAILAAGKHKNDQTLDNISQKLRETASAITDQTISEDEGEVRQLLEREFDRLAKPIIDEKFNQEIVFRQSIEIVAGLCDVVDNNVLVTADLLSYLPFVDIVDGSKSQPIVLNDCLLKIRDKFIAQTFSLEPLARIYADSPRIDSQDIVRSFTYLNCERLNAMWKDCCGSAPTRRMPAGTRERFFRSFHESRTEILSVSICFEALINNVKKCLLTNQSHELSQEISVIQKTLGVVKEMIENIDKELKVFSYRLSTQFCDMCYTCAMLCTVVYYYDRQKTDFLNIRRSFTTTREKLVQKYIQWITLIKNTENIAKNLTGELREYFRRAVESSVKEITLTQVDNARGALKRSSIIKELDSRVDNADNQWLLDYSLRQQTLILKAFDDQWSKIAEQIEQRLSADKQSFLRLFDSIFDTFNILNDILKVEDEYSENLIDTLFEIQNDQIDEQNLGKQRAMAQLFYGYLVGEEIPSKLSPRDVVTYTVNDRWRTLVNRFPIPSEETKQVFRSIKHSLEGTNIYDLGSFIQKILEQRAELKTFISNPASWSVKELDERLRDDLQRKVKGCESKCPCCNRMCDFDHETGATSAVGAGDNQHRCQFGHQLRAMGGIRFEGTNEASLKWCEIIEDDDIIIGKDQQQYSWQEFKARHSTWQFDERSTHEQRITHFPTIWRKIGQEVCKHYGNGMKFVEENKPVPINHFIFILDHSGSMDQQRQSVGQSLWKFFNRQSPEKTPWEHLLDAVQAFIDRRKKQPLCNDRVTMIVFGGQAKRIYDRVKLDAIDVDEVKIPTAECGSSTRYSAAFEEVIKVLREVKNDRLRSRLQQTIVFMTDGEPTDNWDDVFKRLCEYRTSHGNERALIHNFWLMALGEFNKTTVEDIIRRMGGQQVDVKNPEELLKAYVQIAEIIP